MKTETKVCKCCGRELEVENFRLHKSGYRLGKCTDCERDAWRSRKPSKTFTVTTGSGKTFEVSTKPIVGGRKVVSCDSTQVLYTQVGVTRDEARSVYQSYTGVSRSGISATLVG